ncbi:unnamed protein product [Moneuplotes crassus]|uniref:Uncharacterized protein n=1 Tax=Euplotes crassus TaxID=5936 RepID=A0AAD2D768_EUPCR|nr:unnamed protein product [Moneuplotes crassus]
MQESGPRCPSRLWRPLDDFGFSAIVLSGTTNGDHSYFKADDYRRLRNLVNGLANVKGMEEAHLDIEFNDSGMERHRVEEIFNEAGLNKIRFHGL